MTIFGLFQGSQIVTVRKGDKMFGLGITEIVIILAVVLLVFGPSKLPQLGKSIGGAIKNFKGAISNDKGGADKESIS